MSSQLASNNMPPGGGIHIGTAVVQHSGGTLPFTGANLIAYAAVGLAMIVLGVYLRQRSA